MFLNCEEIFEPESRFYLPFEKSLRSLSYFVIDEQQLLNFIRSFKKHLTRAYYEILC